MPLPRLVFALALFGLANAATATATTSTPRQLPADPETVLIVGDSLSAAHRMAGTDGWVALLERRLSVEDATPPTVVNHSRGGKTLSDGMSELPALLRQHRPDVVVLELGGNDAILGMAGAELQANLTRLVRMARASGAEVAVLGFAVPPIFDRDGAADALRTAYATVAQAEGVALLPSLLAGISDAPHLLQHDGIHPNAAAQSRVLDNAWPTLSTLLMGTAAAQVPSQSKGR